MAKILIAEDEPDIRDLITFTLRYAGHEVIATANGEEAFLKAQEVKPDLIMMDVRMPRMTGYEACRKMKEIDALKPVPVIFLSAKGQESEVQAGLAAGAVEYILKPFAPDQLTERVGAILEKFSQPQAAQPPAPAPQAPAARPQAPQPSQPVQPAPRLPQSPSQATPPARQPQTPRPQISQPKPRIPQTPPQVAPPSRRPQAPSPQNPDAIPLTPQGPRTSPQTPQPQRPQPSQPAPRTPQTSPQTAPPARQPQSPQPLPPAQPTPRAPQSTPPTRQPQIPTPTPSEPSPARPQAPFEEDPDSVWRQSYRQTDHKPDQENQPSDQELDDSEEKKTDWPF